MQKMTWTLRPGPSDEIDPTEREIVGTGTLSRVTLGKPMEEEGMVSSQRATLVPGLEKRQTVYISGLGQRNICFWEACHGSWKLEDVGR